MTTTFRRTLASAAAATALLASFALPSYAQTAAPAAPAAATTPKPERPMHKPGERREHMQQRIAKLQAKLLGQRRVAEAKAILMQTHQINEDQAYDMIRAQAMSRRSSVEEIAQAIVHASEILSLGKRVGG